MRFRYGDNHRWYMMGRVAWVLLPQGARPSDVYKQANEEPLTAPPDAESIALLRCCDSVYEHDIALVLRVASSVGQRLQRPIRQILGSSRTSGLWVARSLMVACSMRLGANRAEIGELMERGPNAVSNYAAGFRSRAQRDPELRRTYCEIVDAERYAACCYAPTRSGGCGVGLERAW